MDFSIIFFLLLVACVLLLRIWERARERRDTMLCASCLTRIDRYVRRCPHCQAAQPIVEQPCPTCARVLPSNATPGACGHCNQPLVWQNGRAIRGL